MPPNFIACDRGQVFLMPPSVVDWVPEDHLVWTVLGAVDQMDLAVVAGGRRGGTAVGRQNQRFRASDPRRESPLDRGVSSRWLATRF